MCRWDFPVIQYYATNSMPPFLN